MPVPTISRVTSPAPAPPRPLGVGAANALVFLAAGAVLVLEILGVRLLAPYVGLTLETTTAIIGAALAGIAAGAAAGGFAADRFDGRRLLPLLLAAGGLLCIAAVPLVRAFGDAVRGTSAIAALGIAMMILFPPACVLSAVSPVVAKLRLHDLEHTGRVVGGLSAWATAGALVGTFGTGFVLVPSMPTSTAVFAIGGLLLAVALSVAVRFGLGSREIAAVCVSGAVALAALAYAIGSPCDTESDYHCAAVARRPGRSGGRTLILDDLRHSYVDLDDLGHLEFDYTRWIGDAIDALPPGPLDAVYLGGGGYTLPRYVATVRPGSRAPRARGRRRARRRSRAGGWPAHRARPAGPGRRRARDAARRADRLRRRASSATPSAAARCPGIWRRLSSRARSAASCGPAASTR